VSSRLVSTKPASRVPNTLHSGRLVREVAESDKWLADDSRVVLKNLRIQTSTTASPRCARSLALMGIGFGQPSKRSGKAAYLSRIDDGH